MAISRRTFCKIGLAAGVAASGILDPVPAGAAPRKNRRSLRKAKRVLIIAFDGIRPDGLKQAHTPNIDALIARGAASMTTRDVMPSMTLPNFTSILTGSGPEIHGVNGNKWTLDTAKLPPVEADADGYFPSVFKVLKDKVPGIRTAFYWNWKPLIVPYNQKYMDDTLFAAKDEYLPLYERAGKFMEENADNPWFMFLYTVHTDHAGHKYEWMSPEYIKSIEEGDEQVGWLFERMKEQGILEDTHIFFVTDHGGIGHGHGGVSVEEMIVPWVIAGPGIKQGFSITEANNTVNTATTVLKLFGVDQPLSWTGEVPNSIFK
ncbi:MAG: alkaline phosphatase family protein [Bacteroidales bacterium]|nr:alkaline phosphatase family protein [Bacteroidales bacterium]